MLSKDSVKTLVASSLCGFYDNILKDEFATKKYVDDNTFYTSPNVYYNSEYKNGYILLNELEQYHVYKLPATNTSTRVVMCCKNDDGTLTLVKDPSNVMGLGNWRNGVISVEAAGYIYKDSIYHLLIRTTKTNGKYTYKISPMSLTNNTSNIEYTPKNDYHPATKKYVDDTANTLVKKDTNKYVLITNDDTLVIKKDSITDIADATVTIDNLTGQFGTLVANDDSTYSYTLNTIMTDVETFTFKVNNVEQKLVIVPYKEMKYDDSNAAITYVDGWSIEKNEKCYNGNIHVVTSSDTVASKANFEFVGTGIEVFSLINNQTGRIQVAIWKQKDDGTYPRTAIYRKTINTNYTYSDAAYAFPVISFDNNEYGKYKIEITVGKGETFYLDSICIHNPIYNLNLKIQNLYQPINENTNILYTNKHNPVFNPSRIYDPTTKKYVDDLVQNSTAMCTDEEVDNMLNEVLGGDYSGN